MVVRREFIIRKTASHKTDPINLLISCLGHLLFGSTGAHDRVEFLLESGLQGLLEVTTHLVEVLLENGLQGVLEVTLKSSLENLLHSGLQRFLGATTRVRIINSLRW